MDELPLFNSVFPFDCGYQSCDKVYHLEDFIHVALLWGFINLISEEYQLVGFTCPACRRTSIRKLKLDVEDFSIDIMEDACRVLNIGNGDKNIQFREFVPFSKRILYTEYIVNEDQVPGYEKINLEPFSQEISFKKEFSSDGIFIDEASINKNFSIPDYIKPQKGTYPKGIQSEFPYSFHEKYILHLRDVENTVSRKSIPRVYSNYNVYQYTEAWLKGFPYYDPKSSLKIKKEIMDAFESAAKFQNISNLNHLVLNRESLSTKHIRQFSDLVDRWYQEKSSARFQFFNGYRCARNRIGYDIEYRDKFVMNYIYAAATAPPKPIRKVAILEKRRLACRKAAEKIWAKEPEITIADMIMRNEIANACDDVTYTEKTIRDWIKELCPNRKPGRRKTKK